MTGTKTAAGGVDWGETLVQNGGAPVYAVDYFSATGARFADGDGDVYETTDGGTTWTSKGIASNGKVLYRICCESADRTVAVGGGGTFAEFDGTGWSVGQVGGTDVYAVDRVGSDGVAAGGSGYAYEYVDGSWEQKGTGSSATLRAAVQSDVSRFGRIRDGATAVDALAGSSNTVYDRGECTGRPDEIRVEHVGGPPVAYGISPGYGVSVSKGAEADDTTNADAPRVRGTVDTDDPVDSYRSSDSFDQFLIREGTIGDVAVYVNGEERSAEVVDGAGWTYVNEDSLPTGNTLYAAADTDAAPTPPESGERSSTAIRARTVAGPRRSRTASPAAGRTSPASRPATTARRSGVPAIRANSVPTTSETTSSPTTPSPPGTPTTGPTSQSLGAAAANSSPW